MFVVHAMILTFSITPLTAIILPKRFVDQLLASNNEDPDASGREVVKAQ